MNTKRIPVWFKVSFPILASLGLFVFIIFGVHMPDVRQRLIEQKKIEIRDIVESATGVLIHEYTLYSNGTLTEAQAKKNAMETLAEMKFGQDFKNYLWITNYEPRMVMHPYRTDLNGKMLNKLKDPNGKLLFVDMVKATEATGSGYVNYMWQNKDNSKEIIPKITYVRRFEPWHWIIGAGVYLQDVNEEVVAQTHRLLVYTLSVFFFIIALSGFAVYSGMRTNKKLRISEDELRALNEELENRVKYRTQELNSSLENLKKAQTQLIESEKMASLGSLVAGVAHEINTPVGIGVTTITHLDEKLDETADLIKSGQLKKSDLDSFMQNAKESVGIVVTNLTRAADLVKSFKQVAVDQTYETARQFNLKHYMGDILLSLKPVLKHTPHEIEIVAPENIVINSYPGAFTQIFSNLIMNSLKHGFENIEKGTIRIEIKADEKNITILYSDNGNGMNKQQLSKLYEPFYTTKRDHGGSGLGMNIVYNLITRLLGGTILVSSEQGKGTLFIITVPMETQKHE